MKTSWLPVAVVLGVLLGGLAAGRAEAIPYTYTSIADNTGPFSSVNSIGRSPSINDAGTVAFLADLRAGGTGVFTGAGGPLTTVATTAGPLSSFLSGPYINSGGTVAFVANLDNGTSGVFTGSGGPLTPLYTSPPFSELFSAAPINAAGTVAFLARFPLDTNVGVLSGNGGPATTIADTIHGPFNGFTINQQDINNAGKVAFYATLPAPAPGEGIFTGSGGAVTPVFSTSGFSTLFFGLALNDPGTAAFLLIEPGGQARIVTGNGGPLTTVADTDGLFSSFSLGGPAINNADTVAFLASLDDGSSGIFTGPDPVNNKVIAAGDALFGSSVASLFLFREGLNDAGQIAFLATLADGRELVVRADPVPEPPIFLLLGAGAFTVMAYRWRRGRWDVARTRG
jgi:hypothetical protein